MTPAVPAASILEARGIERSYGGRRVLAGVDLDLRPGDVVALEGPNGAGKSTLIALLAGLARPDAGTVLLAGADPRIDPEARRGLGLVLHEDGLYDDLTAEENLRFHAALHGIDGAGLAARAALERAGLAERAGDRVRAFSRGMRRRTALARALLHRPAVLLLDEPTAGLDADSTARLDAEVAAAAGRGAAVLYATHQARLAATSRAVRLEGGRLR